MRNIKVILVMLICLICVACQPITKPETPEVIIPTDSGDVVSTDIPYDEVEDSLEGLTEEQISDLSDLKAAFDSVGTNYVSQTKVYFNALAVSRYHVKFSNKNFRCQQTILYNDKYTYKYTDDGLVNRGRLDFNNNLYSIELLGNTLEERFNSNINQKALKLIANNKSIKDQYLTLANFNSVYVNCEKDDLTNFYFPLSQFNGEYVDTHGPANKVTTVYGEVKKDYKGWTRISENKYMCDRSDVVEHFLTICAPDYPIKDGAYMTYTHVTVEINPTDDTFLRLRVYASSTQIGKLIQSHTEKEKTNWYLLFAESNISSVGNAKIEAFENLYK